jgi:hypothetical protein
MPLFDYTCNNNHVTSSIVKYDDREEPQVCSDCGEPSYFKQTFCTNFQYGKDYSSFSSDNHKWNLRENHRNKTVGKSYT